MAIMVTDRAVTEKWTCPVVRSLTTGPLVEMTAAELGSALMPPPTPRPRCATSLSGWWRAYCDRRAPEIGEMGAAALSSRATVLRAPQRLQADGDEPATTTHSCG